MEFLTIVLSSLLTLISPGGLAIDTVAEHTIRSQFETVEQLQVRVDNTPNYQILQGKAERVRIAGRGLWPRPDIRIDTLEIETDPIFLNVGRLRQGGQTSPMTSLQQPLQAGVRLVLTEADINQALKSPDVVAQFQQISRRLSRGPASSYQLINPQVKFLENQRLQFQVDAVEKDNPPLNIVLESGLQIRNGHTLQLIEPSVKVAGQAVPSLFVQSLAASISSRLNLQSLEDAGITARVLKLEINPQQLEIAAFVRVEAKK